MERVNRIIRHPAYQECLAKNREAERGRKFCCHDMAHLLDVGRIAWIHNLEEGTGVPKELVYGAALLHDCGRFRQYEDQTPHEQAGARIAAPILRDCGFGPEEVEMILEAIRNHRCREHREDRDLSGLLYRADKESRSCFACPALAQCRWEEEKKNKELLL